MSRHEKDDAGQAVKRSAWTRPEVLFVGTLDRVLKGGTGKLSPTDQDPGDYRKPSGQG